MKFLLHADAGYYFARFRLIIMITSFSRRI